MRNLFSKINKIYFGYPVMFRLKVFLSWVNILIKNRFVAVNSSGQQKILNYKYLYGHRGSLYGMFAEIFIDQNYAISYTEEPLNIIDGGSNMGIAIAYFQTMAPNSKILSFEPNPETFRILKQNILNNNLKVNAVNSGLGSSDRDAVFYTDTKDESSQSASLTKHLESKGRELKEIQVKIEKLSKYITEPVDILKLDIEGAEGEVLEDLLEQNKLDLIKVMFIEYHTDGENTTYPLSRLLEILEIGNFKYEIFSNYELPFAYWKGTSKIQSFKITAWKE